ncbi:hypothetical protein Q3V30_12965 [Erwinia pyri]|uniref:Uncharacterized protein n=1 Tax=Erwinia pyri TaxID=3062598 RepID=A0AA50DFM5_9GAMM|nr:hypothetical protein [Erwinia sp. DE2]WLS77396.1 hypothetical protein Q3V30_12965 [Erwinia sp. DE2]
MADTTQLAQQAIDSVNQLKEMADQAVQNQAALEELYEENTRLNSQVDSLQENLTALDEVFHQRVIEEDDYLSYAQDMLKDISNMIDSGELGPFSIEKVETLRITLQVVASIRSKNHGDHPRRPGDAPKQTLRQVAGYDE